MSTFTETEQTVKQWRSWLDRQKIVLKSLTETRDTLTADVAATEAHLADLKEARDIIITAVSSTQSEVQLFIEDMVSLALQSVFGEDYSFKLEFTIKRNQSEVESFVMRKEVKLSPRDDETGGGVVDVASFALRLVIWTLGGQRSRATFILDEPFKFVSRDKTEAVAAMLKALTDLLHIQIIMVSHDEGLIQCANRSWRVVLDGDGISQVRMEENSGQS